MFEAMDGRRAGNAGAISCRGHGWPSSCRPVEGKSRRVQRAAQQAMREPRVGFLSATFLYPNKERQLGAAAGRSEAFSAIRSKSPSSAFGTFSRNGRRKNAVFGAVAGRSEGSDVGLVQLIESAESQVAAIAAMHLSSMAIGVGRAVMPRVVRQGCAVVKCSA